MSIITIRLFKQRKNKEILEKDDIIFSKKWELVGVKLNKLLEKEILEIKNEYDLSIFYSSQNKMKCLLKNYNELNITFIDIDFYPEIDEEDYVEIRRLLRNKKIDELLKYVEEMEDVDISRLTFILGEQYGQFLGTSVSITNTGNLTTDCDVEIEFKDLLSSQFLGILTGKYSLCKE